MTQLGAEEEAEAQAANVVAAEVMPELVGSDTDSDWSVEMVSDTIRVDLAEAEEGWEVAVMRSDAALVAVMADAESTEMNATTNVEATDVEAAKRKAAEMKATADVEAAEMRAAEMKVVVVVEAAEMKAATYVDATEVKSAADTWDVA